MKIGANDKVRVGIIGCGGIANGKHLPSLKQVADVEMVAFCDLIIEKAEKAAKQYGTPDAKVYTEKKNAEEAAQKINDCKKNGGRVICVGTTSCRTLESVASKHGKIIPCSDDTGIFIYPGYEFRCMDAIITNFHLPESTLIMLVSAFSGYENTMNAYNIAVEEKYRFFSFGDAMFIY